MRQRPVSSVEDDAARQGAVRHLSPHRPLVRDQPHHDVARELAGVHRCLPAAPVRRPRPRSGASPWRRSRRRRSPRMAAMARGATRQVITAERSRTRRRNSLRVMMRAVSRRAPDRGSLSSRAETTFGRRDRAGARRVRRRWADRSHRRRLGRRRGGDPPRRCAVRARRGGGPRSVLPRGRGLPVPPGRSGRRAVGRPPAPGEPGLARGGHVRPAGEDAAQPTRCLDLPPHRRGGPRPARARASTPSTGRRCSTSSPSCASSSRSEPRSVNRPGPPS